MSTRFCIGIDLGTTNSALAYIDTLTGGESRVFPIHQRVNHSSDGLYDLLPSALLYETSSNSWQAGRIALEEKGYQPEQVVLSAKSWLSHSGVNRLNKILPWSSKVLADSSKLSPVEASAELLTHLKRAWESQMGIPFAACEVVLTVPASFDDVAQKLTLEAAKMAGYPPETVLLEEPQAAFYRYLERVSITALPPGSTILVCDVGGGTSDFSLFEIDDSKATTRIAVSEHILLGGDNIDRAIAGLLESRSPRELSYRERETLVFQSRLLKHQVLEPDGREAGDAELHVALAGATAALFSSVLSLTARAAEVHELALDGFFPRLNREEKVDRGRGALREWGLPFARDHRVTAHLSEFLSGRSVDAVLFNGGTLTSPLIRRRIVDCIAEWQDGKEPIALPADELDLAVARGAAWYALKRRRSEQRILGGYPRSLYLELHGRGCKRLLCVIPRGAEFNEAATVAGPPIRALVDRPVRFQVWSSLVHPEHRSGDIVDANEYEYRSTAPLVTKLDLPKEKTRPAEGMVDVEIVVALTETGTCKFVCRAKEPYGSEWELNYNLRGEERLAAEPEITTEEKKVLNRAADVIDRYFGKRREDIEGNPKHLTRELEQLMRTSRERWNLSLLRGMWPSIARGTGRRSRSESHEQVWLNLAGFLLRPGFGHPMDAMAVDELWKTFRAGRSFPKNANSTDQWWILWRRVAGGIDAARQEEVFRAAWAEREKGTEVVRTIGALERLSHERKEAAIKWGWSSLESTKQEALRHAITSALGRLGAREPLYGEIDATVAPELIEPWIEKLLSGGIADKKEAGRLAIEWARYTGDPSRDVSIELRTKVERFLRSSGGEPDRIRLLWELQERTIEETAQLFGDSLPAGIILARAA